MSDLKAIETQLADAARRKDEPSVRRLAEEYYRQEGAVVLPAELQFAAASCFAKAADYSRAASCYRRFIRFYGGHARVDEARYRLGVLYARYLKKPAEAKRYLSLVAGKGPAERSAAAARILEKMEAPPQRSSQEHRGSPNRYVVVVPNEGALNVSAVGREIAAALNKRLVDVTRDIKASHVILALDVDRPAAEKIVGALAAISIPARSIPETEFPSVPIPELVTRASFTESGYALHVGGTIVAGKYGEIRLIAAARMRLLSADLVKRRSGGDTMGGYAGVRVFSPGSEERTVREGRATEYGVIDVFLRHSPRRLRLDERHLELAADDERAVNKRLNLRLHGERLAAFARDVPANRALPLFLGRMLVSTPWEDFTFDTDRAFDLYCRWLLAVKG